ncbi:MAG TPA: sucrase ferredoxin [Nocardioidaceae bacterium]|jgi:hypothetical protein|nr:sucrase ferredoxin [Nocardioidaceae bacterium]
MTFRCAVASLERDEAAVGSASTVRAFLLVENAGPWGVDALRDARLPEHVKSGLRDRAARTGVRVLLVRRHRGASSGPGLRVFAAWADAADPWLETATVAGPEQLLDLDVVALGRGRSPGLTPTTRPVFCVCTHGRHDSCCASLGRPTAAALTASHPEETWDVSHVGGDRFAANVLVLPEGLYYGRVSAAAAPALADRHLAGHLELDLLRGRSGFDFAVQAAEVAVRRRAGETRTDAVRLLATRRSSPDADLAVRFDVAGTPYDVVVRRSRTPEEHQLTCRARRLEVAPTYEVRSVALG